MVNFSHEFVGAGVRFVLFAEAGRYSPNKFSLGANADPENNGSLYISPELCLASQSALWLRELPGAKRRVRRGPSLGDSTSAGAENSQSDLHTVKRPIDDGILSLTLAETTLYPVFALLPPESSILFKNKDLRT